MAFSRCVGMGMVATLGPPTESEPPTQGAARGEAEGRAGAQRGPPAVALTAVRSPQAPWPAGRPAELSAESQQEDEHDVDENQERQHREHHHALGSGGQVAPQHGPQDAPGRRGAPPGVRVLRHRRWPAGSRLAGRWLRLSGRGLGGPPQAPAAGRSRRQLRGAEPGLSHARSASYVVRGTPASPPACALATSRSGGAERVARTGWAARLGQGCSEETLCPQSPHHWFPPLGWLARRTGDQGGPWSGCLGFSAKSTLGIRDPVIYPIWDSWC